MFAGAVLGYGKFLIKIGLPRDRAGRNMTDTDFPQDPDTAAAGAGYFSDDAATFGDRVAAARRAMGMDQAKLSRKLGIKLKTLRAWEEDVSEPRANKLQMLAGVLNVSIVWILTGEGEGVSDPWEDTPAPRADLREILNEMRALRAEHKRLGDRFALLQKHLAKAIESGA